MEKRRYSCNVLFVIIYLTTSSLCSAADRDHWQIIYSHLKECEKAEDSQTAKAAGEQLGAYVNSLTARQLVEAARQFCTYIQDHVPVDSRKGATQLLEFFVRRYPEVSGDLSNISPLLSDVQDKSQVPLWRATLAKMLAGTWRAKLSVERCLDSATTMRHVYSDPADSPFVRATAVNSSSYLLRHAYKVNLRNDPNVVEFIKNLKHAGRYLDAVRDGRIKLSEATSIMDRRIRAEITSGIAEQLALFESSQLDTPFREMILITWMRYHSLYLDTPSIKEAMAEAVHDFEQYDEEVWERLIYANLECYQNEEAKAALNRMLNKTKDWRRKERLLRKANKFRTLTVEEFLRHQREIDKELYPHLRTKP